MCPSKVKNFKSLRDEWYQILKEDGFNDIEQTDGLLKFWTNTRFRVVHNVELYESKKKYFELAGQYCHDGIFKSEINRKIWQLHSEGLSIREIADKIKETSKNYKKSKVHKVVNETAKEMLKIYEGSNE